MKILLSIFLYFLSSTTFCQQYSNPIKNAQQEKATTFVELVENRDSGSAFKLLDDSYYLNKRGKLPIFSSLFNMDFKSLPPETKRYVTLVLPDGLNLFRFRYIDSSGTILQVDVSYKTDINSKIVDLGLITTKSFNNQRKTNRAAGYDFN
jgi:hypothetical protein